MIKDSLRNIENYKGLDKIYDVLKFLAKTDFSDMETGKYIIDGDNIFYMVQEYDTKPNENTGESHKKYIDIQLIINGEEIIGYAPISCDKKVIDASDDKDFYLYACDTVDLVMNSGDFMVLYPDDIHNPGVMTDKPAKCRKVVVKIKI